MGEEGWGRFAACQGKPRPPQEGTSQGAKQTNVLQKTYITSHYRAGAAGCQSGSPLLPIPPLPEKQGQVLGHNYCIELLAPSESPSIAQALDFKSLLVVVLTYSCKSHLVSPDMPPSWAIRTPTWDQRNESSSHSTGLMAFCTGNIIRDQV